MLIGDTASRGHGGAAGCRSSVKRIEASVAAMTAAAASRRRQGTRSGEGEGGEREREGSGVVGEAGGEAKWSSEAVALM